MADTPQSQAKKTALAFIQQARSVGWDRIRVCVAPDGTVSLDTFMTEEASDDDFETVNLKM